LDQNECDDGNTIDGDGCSSQCKIESGFNCYKTNGPDICYDIVPPKATMQIKRVNRLIITFSETVIIRTNSTKLAESMKITLIDAPYGCTFSWSINGSFAQNTKLNEIEISAYPKCSLKANVQEFVVEFRNPYEITDSAWNELQTPRLKVKSHKFSYVSQEQKEAVRNTGGAFDSVSLLTFVIMIGFFVLQSVAIGSLWAFVNMLQMISYLPIINCSLPYNFETFITEYLTVNKVSIPFKMLPSWIYNPLGLFLIFETRPFNLRFMLGGYDTISFLYNFAEELVTWCLIFLFYLFLRILTYIIPENKYFSLKIIENK